MLRFLLFYCPMSRPELHQLAFNTLIELSTEEGINASGKDEVYGCIFGRDSFITILKIIRSFKKTKEKSLLDISRGALNTLVALQGKEFNIESGEQPGKFIHEFRRNNFEKLTTLTPSWYVYPDGILRNYDSIDSTPLGLIAIYNFWEATADQEFLSTMLPTVESALNWIITYGDLDKDYLLEYDFPITRQYGGLVVQSWTDSGESLRQVDGSFPRYPIAPIEAQGYSWLALKVWGEVYKGVSPSFANKLLSFAENLKIQFNQKFIFDDGELKFAAQALDGDKNKIKTITANPMLCLWAALENNGTVESIIDDEFIEDIVKRVFLPDMFVRGAGLRTMSSLSPTFNPNADSYHNGSFWPMLNGKIIEGLENFGFLNQANLLKEATLEAIEYFGTPIELFIKDGDNYFEYTSPAGQKGCRQQAWSAAALLDITS